MKTDPEMTQMLELVEQYIKITIIYPYARDAREKNVYDKEKHVG